MKQSTIIRQGLIWLLLMISVYQTQAQSGSPKAAVKLLSRAYQDSIKLRWAPTTPLLWKYGQQYGYQLEKFLVYQNGKILTTPQKLPLAKSFFKVLPAKDWQALLEKDEQATVAYQAMFGEKMQVNHSNRILKIVEQAEEQQLRFAFALMAADYSMWVAQASGLSFTDTAVKKGEKYLYRIKVAMPTQLIKAEAGNVYVGVGDQQALPKPVELQGQFGDKKVMLVWNQLYYQHIYSAYFVERSEDGKNYQLTSKLPHTSIEREGLGGMPQRFMTVIDSLPQNGKTYYFRIRGYTPFAELGPPSDSVIVGKGKSEVNWQIVLKKPVVRKQKVQLTWKVPAKIQDKIKGVSVEKASQAKGKYQALQPQLLGANQTSFTDEAASGATYYRVKVLGKNGEEATSFPHLVQLPDSIPPDAPVKLLGKVDTMGIVSIRWTAPQAKDVKGYHIFRSEGPNDEFTRINKVLVSAASYTDSINLRTLNPHIHYKIQAVDHYFNPSDLSQMLQLKRPDKIAPLSPVFVKVVSTDSSLYLKWQPSASQDVAHHLLYRSEMGKNQWQLVADFARLDTTALQAIKDTALHATHYVYHDITATAGQMYQYTLVAVDSSRLESPPSRPVSAKRMTKNLLPAVKKLKISKNLEEKHIRLEWAFEQAPIKSFKVYRAEGEEGLRLYKIIQPKVGKSLTVFQDTGITKGNWYQYRIQAATPGKVAKFSKVVTIKY